MLYASPDVRKVLGVSSEDLRGTDIWRYIPDKAAAEDLRIKANGLLLAQETAALPQLIRIVCCMQKNGDSSFKARSFRVKICHQHATQTDLAPFVT